MSSQHADDLCLFPLLAVTLKPSPPPHVQAAAAAAGCSVVSHQLHTVCGTGCCTLGTPAASGSSCPARAASGWQADHADVPGNEWSAVSALQEVGSLCGMQHTYIQAPCAVRTHWAPETQLTGVGAYSVAAHGSLHGQGDRPVCTWLAHRGDAAVVSNALRNQQRARVPLIAASCFCKPASASTS